MVILIFDEGILLFNFFLLRVSLVSSHDDVFVCDLLNIIYVLLKFWYKLFLYSMEFIGLEFDKVFEAFFVWKIWIGLRALSKDRGVKKLIQDFLISEIWKKMFVRLSELDNFRLLTFTFADATCFLDQRIRKTKLAKSSLFCSWCDRPIFRLDLFFLFLTYL